MGETPEKAPKKKKFVLSAVRAAKPTVDYASALNAEQLAAATAPPGPVLVIAGAGTGKTRVITYRTAYLMETGARPDEILLLTFTNKAAREMMSRVESLVGGSVGADIHRLWGGTFHHIGNRILRRYADRLGYREGYTILDREDARSLMRACVADRRGAASGKRFPQAQVLCSIHSLAVNTQSHAADVIGTRYPHVARHTDEVLAIMRSYEERKRTVGAMDYDDLLWNWLRLVEDAEFRNSLRARFRHCLVDEYQDTNVLQGGIVDSLCLPDRSLTVVGDDSQAIYAWRGATPENILTFPNRYPTCRTFKLETNYRSTPEVLEVANRSLTANPRRFEKDLRSSRRPGVFPEVVPCRDAFQQSRFVAERILRMHEDGVSLEDIVVLYRSHWNALELQLEMQRRDIPFRVRGGIRFFEQAHIKDVTSFLRAVINPRDEIAWYRILPLVPHVGPATARSVVNVLEGLDDPVGALADEAVAGLVVRKARGIFGRLADVMREISASDMRASPCEMIGRVVDGFYDEHLVTRYANARLRREDLSQLALYAGQFDSAESFLSELALAGVVEAETSPVGPDEDRYVTLSTVHQAKGLEWNVVFVIWLADGRFPTDFAGKVEGGYEEERRLFHVAVTRARDELVLAYPLTYRWRGMNTVLMKRSRFLSELDTGPHGDTLSPCYEVVEIEEPVPPELELPPPGPAGEPLPLDLGPGLALPPAPEGKAQTQPGPDAARRKASAAKEPSVKKPGPEGKKTPGPKQRKKPGPKGKKPPGKKPPGKKGPAKKAGTKPGSRAQKKPAEGPARNPKKKSSRPSKGRGKQKAGR